MSFYGSVYYQLIDTYYKIIVKNSGNETFTFNKAIFNPSGTPDEDLIESPAVGRKGIFTLDSGNYWINFSELKDSEASAPYAIWHSEPHKSENSVPIGFYPEDKYEEREDKNTGKKEIYNKETGEKLIEGADYIQLYENNFFRVYNQKHDEAGHTYDDDNLSSLYRLPKSETSDDIDELQTYVGVITDENKDDPFMVDRAPKKWLDNDPTKNIPLKSLFQYAEGHEDTIGTWDDTVWGKDGEEGAEPCQSIADTIGAWKDVWSNGTNLSIADTIGQWSLKAWGNEEVKNIADTIGNMKKLLDTREDAPVDLVTSIGSLNDLFTKFLSSGSEENGDYASAEQNRLKKFGKINNIVTAIGNMVYFWNKYTGNAETNQISLTDAILKNKENYDYQFNAETGQTTLKLADLDRDLGVLEDSMGLRQDEGRVYDEIRSLKYDIIDIDIKEAGEGSVYDEIHKERQRAKYKEEKLQDNIDNEVNRAKGVESGLQNNINKEVERAQQVESVLRIDLNNEITRATSEETSLSNRINDIETSVGSKNDSTKLTLYGKVNSLEENITYLFNAAGIKGNPDEEVPEEKTLIGMIAALEARIAALEGTT